MGMDSNLRAVRDLFPDVRRAVLYTPRRILESSAEELRADLTRVADNLSPCDIVLADLPADTRDLHMLRFLTLCRELEETAHRQ